MNLIYCFDPYCGWCYGFSPVLKKVLGELDQHFFVEVLSGGMILPQTPQAIGVIAPVVQKEYKTVEEYSGVKFGEDYLWHISHPQESDWFPDSLKPAIALSVIKSFNSEQGLNFASDLQYALNFEGRDLTDDEAYRHLLPKYEISEDQFYKNLQSEEFLEKARYDFALVKQLQINSFPTLLLQESEIKFHLLAKGYTDEKTLKMRLNRAVEMINKTD